MEIADLSVLLVEPSEIQTRIICEQLQSLGVQRLRTMHSGERALEIIERRDSHVVISAMHLPDMTGTDLIVRLRELDCPVDAPAFLLISSETKDMYLEPVRQAGACGILPKPFGVEELKTALEHAIDLLDPGELHVDEVDLEEVRALVVDDSSANRRFICHLLAGMGIEQVEQAEDGAAAVPIIQEHFFDVVLTDLNMPNMDGLGLVRYVRQESGQSSVPVIMITSENDHHRLEEVCNAGVSAICPKPFEPRVLKRLFQKLLHPA